MPACTKASSSKPLSHDSPQKAPRMSSRVSPDCSYLLSPTRGKQALPPNPPLEKEARNGRWGEPRSPAQAPWVPDAAPPRGDRGLGRRGAHRGRLHRNPPRHRCESGAGLPFLPLGRMARACGKGVFFRRHRYVPTSIGARNLHPRFPRLNESSSGIVSKGEAPVVVLGAACAEHAPLHRQGLAILCAQSPY